MNWWINCTFVLKTKFFARVRIVIFADIQRLAWPHNYVTNKYYGILFIPNLIEVLLILSKGDSETVSWIYLISAIEVHSLRSCFPLYFLSLFILLQIVLIYSVVSIVCWTLVQNWALKLITLINIRVCHWSVRRLGVQWANAYFSSSYGTISQ
jgi:hypothetical protein